MFFFQWPRKKNRETWTSYVSLQNIDSDWSTTLIDVHTHVERKNRKVERKKERSNSMNHSGRRRTYEQNRHSAIHSCFSQVSWFICIMEDRFIWTNCIGTSFGFNLNVAIRAKSLFFCCVFSLAVMWIIRRSSSIADISLEGMCVCIYRYSSQVAMRIEQFILVSSSLLFLSVRVCPFLRSASD